MYATKTADPRRKCLLTNVRVFDGTGFADCRSVVIDGGIIGNDPEGADEIIDGKGHFLIPGLVDAHVHLHHEGHLHALASYGITTGHGNVARRQDERAPRKGWSARYQECRVTRDGLR